MEGLWRGGKGTGIFFIYSKGGGSGYSDDSGCGSAEGDGEC